MFTQVTPAVPAPPYRMSHRERVALAEMGHDAENERAAQVAAELSVEVAADAREAEQDLAQFDALCADFLAQVDAPAPTAPALEVHEFRLAHPERAGDWLKANAALWAEVHAAGMSREREARLPGASDYLQIFDLPSWKCLTPEELRELARGIRSGFLAPDWTLAGPGESAVEGRLTWEEMAAIID